MIEAAQLIEPTMSFAGGVVGAGAIWSFRARQERHKLKRQIVILLKEAEPHLLSVYHAIEKNDESGAKAVRSQLEVLGRSLESRLERYALIHELSDRSSEHISKLIPHTKILPALGKFAENFTSQHTSGKISFGELMDLKPETSLGLTGAPDSVDLIRKKFKVSPLSKNVRSAHEKAVALVTESRHKFELRRTEGHDIFLAGNQEQ